MLTLAQEGSESSSGPRRAHIEEFE